MGELTVSALSALSEKAAREGEDNIFAEGEPQEVCDLCIKRVTAL